MFGFIPLGGAMPTTPEAVTRYLSGRQGPTIDIGGAEFPIDRYLTRMILITGISGCGKTTQMLLILKQLARHFVEYRDLKGTVHAALKMRWYIIDPTGLYLVHLFRILHPSVPIYRVTPEDLHGLKWDAAADIGTSPDLAMALCKTLFAEAMAKTNEQFWTIKGYTVPFWVIMTFVELGGDWTLADLVRCLSFPQFLLPILKQSKSVSGAAAHDLQDKMGQGIIATASGPINQLATAAAAMEKAAGRFTFSGPDGFLNQNAVMHFGFTPESMNNLGPFASAMVRIMTLHAFRRPEEANHTFVVCDEGRYLSDLPLEEIMARGRQHGMSCVLSAVGVEGLSNKWGKGRTGEILESPATWLAFSSGYATAKEFCDLVGPVHGLQRSSNVGANCGTTVGASYGNGGTTNTIPQGTAGQLSQLQGGNPNLRPEQADTYSFGTTFNLGSRLDASIDYFKIDLDGAVGPLSAPIIMNNCLTTGNPVYCSQIRRNSAGGLTGATVAGGGYIVQTNVNIGAASVSGIDLQSNYRLPLGSHGTLNLALNGSYLLRTTTTPYPGAHTYDCVGLFGFTCQTVNPKWRHILRATWKTPGNLTLAATWRYLGEVKQDNNDSDQSLQNAVWGVYDPFNARIPAYSWFDVAATYKLGRIVELRAGINNITDRNPPLIVNEIITGGGGNTIGIYDILGREVFLGITAKF
jgi:hypothetical protein